MRSAPPLAPFAPFAPFAQLAQLAQLAPFAPLASVVCAIALASAGCPDDLLADAPCEEDENCPSGLLCSDEGICVGEDGLEGEEGEGEEGEGEGEGEGEAGEGEGEQADDCFFGDVEFDITSDEDLDAIAGCTTVVGDFVVSGGNIFNLDAFASVEVVDGDITFTDLSEVESHEGLGSLAVVTGELEVSGEDAEDVMLALAGLTEIGEALDIEDTDIITLRGFEALQSIGGDLFFGDNPFLESLGDGAFASLEVIGGSVVAENNPSLAMCQLEGLATSAESEPALIDAGGNSDGVCG